MALEKATIEPKIGGGESFEVLFNPTEYRLSQSNQFAEIAIPGLAGPLLQFGRGNARTLSMQLFFDTYEQRTDVRDHTSKLIKLLEIDPELHAPPVSTFVWGKFQFTAVLERAEQRFVLFLDNGTPVRATVDVTFKEFYEGGQRDLMSADFTKRHVVSRGDTLSAIAAERYGDPGLWRPIAEENNLDDPLSIQPGQVLVIPALE
jgi:nucleoid-associated protein YgaU